MASSHTYQKLVFAVDVDIHPVAAAAAERNFLVQPNEVAGSERSLKAVQAASTHQEMVAAGIDRIFVVQLHEATGSDSSLSAFQSASDTHQEVVGARIDINTVAAEESNFVVQVHEAAGSESSLEVQSASATRQELVVAAGVDIHTVAAAERNFVVTQLHEASPEPKMRLMADLMSPAEEEAVVAPTTRVLESLEASLIYMNPEAASPHDYVDEPAEEDHEQLLRAAAPVNLINSPAPLRLTHEPYHDTHDDAHDIDTPGSPAAATG